MKIDRSRSYVLERLEMKKKLYVEELKHAILQNEAKNNVFLDNT